MVPQPLSVSLARAGIQQGWPTRWSFITRGGWILAPAYLAGRSQAHHAHLGTLHYRIPLQSLHLQMLLPSPSPDHKPYGSGAQPQGSPVILSSGEEEVTDFQAGTEPRVAGTDQCLVRLEPEDIRQRKHFESLSPIALRLGHKNMPFLPLILLPIALDIKRIQIIQVSKKNIKVPYKFTIWTHVC